LIDAYPCIKSLLSNHLKDMIIGENKPISVRPFGTKVLAFLTKKTCPV